MKRLFATSLLLATIIAVGAIADTTDFRVNIDGGTAQQNSPRIAAYGAGKFAIAWVDGRNVTSDVYIQHFDSSAQPIGTEIKVNDDDSSYQFEPAIGIDVAGNAGLVWKDYRNSNYPFDPDIYLQRFSSAGNRLGGNIDLTNELPDSMKETPDISYSTWGEGVVVWADYRNQNWDIYGQRINASGGLVGTNFKVNDDAGTSSQAAPRVSASSDGWFVVVWYDLRAGNYDIYAQLYDSLAHKVGTNTKINTDAGTARQAFPDVATDGRGHFTVVWVDWRNGVYPSNPDIYAAKLDTDMVAVTSNMQLNMDGTSRAQRDPSIAADRLGNVAIVWGDSTSSSWNVVGQVIDVDGVVRESNFNAHEFTDSAQLKPDIAIDGRKRYMTWVDNRNGNFDIYASVQTYNSPSLGVDPSLLSFVMDKGGTNPANKSVAVEAVGYNELGFKVVEDLSWLSVTPSTATTPATLSFQISGGALDYGSYTGLVTLVDTLNHDSSVTVAVRLDIVQPRLELSTDTIRLTGVPSSTTLRSATVDVTNGTSGTLLFTVTDSSNWIVLSSDSGTAPETITISASAESLASGLYFAPVIFASTGAIGSPDTVWVEFTVASTYPVFAPTPDSIVLRTSTLSGIESVVVVGNSGAVPLNWKLTSYDSWMIPSRLSGTDNDSISVSYLPTLKTKPYVGQMVLADTSFGIDTSVTVILDYFEETGDSVIIDSTVLPPSSTAPVHGWLYCESSSTGAILRLSHDTSRVIFDSVVVDSVVGLAGSFTTTLALDNGHTLVALAAADSITANSKIYFSLWATSSANSGDALLDTAMTLISYSHFVSTDSSWRSPKIAIGGLSVDATTAVGERPPLTIPGTVVLYQNYPNPFNLSTVIEFDLPRRTDVKLEIFNVLGQRVRVILDEPSAAGNHRVEWDGHSDQNGVAPSGVYFYRLTTSSSRLVKKLVLVK
ncbi:MAG: T9SS type A sorting domain-containing protein [Candidatus Zixiibacteriota bacterium]